jgi:hypothetical protein
MFVEGRVSRRWMRGGSLAFLGEMVFPREAMVCFQEAFRVRRGTGGVSDARTVGGCRLEAYRRDL